MIYGKIEDIYKRSEKIVDELEILASKMLFDSFTGGNSMNVKKEDLIELYRICF